MESAQCCVKNKGFNVRYFKIYFTMFRSSKNVFPGREEAVCWATLTSRQLSIPSASVTTNEYDPTTDVSQSFYYV